MDLLYRLRTAISVAYWYRRQLRRRLPADQEPTTLTRLPRPRADYADFPPPPPLVPSPTPAPDISAQREAHQEMGVRNALLSSVGETGVRQPDRRETPSV